MGNMKTKRRVENGCNKNCCKKVEKKCECKDLLNHINRIEGQIKTLKKYVNEGRRCEDVAMLSTSIAKSFDSLRVQTLRNFFINEILAGIQLGAKDKKRIEDILKLYKK